MLTHFLSLGTNGVEHSQIVALKKAALNHVHAAGWRVVIKPCVDQQSSCSGTFCFQQKSKREAARRIGRPAGNLGDDQYLGWIVPGEHGRVGAMPTCHADFGFGVAGKVAVAVVRVVGDQDELELRHTFDDLAQEWVDRIEFANGRDENPKRL